MCMACARIQLEYVFVRQIENISIHIARMHVNVSVCEPSTYLHAWSRSQKAKQEVQRAHSTNEKKERRRRRRETKRRRNKHRASAVTVVYCQNASFQMNSLYTHRYIHYVIVSRVLFSSRWHFTNFSFHLFLCAFLARTHPPNSRKSKVKNEMEKHKREKDRRNLE